VTNAEQFNYEFLESIPEHLQERVLYISTTYATVVHLCACGCRREVVTPLSPTDWELTFHGDTVSLSPSVGNWNLSCRSHYWIRRGRVRWAGWMSPEEIAIGRAQSRRRKQLYARMRRPAPEQ